MTHLPPATRFHWLDTVALWCVGLLLLPLTLAAFAGFIAYDANVRRLAWRRARGITSSSLNH